jgi:hypothetical protein
VPSCPVTGTVVKWIFENSLAVLVLIGASWFLVAFVGAIVKDFNKPELPSYQR